MAHCLQASPQYQPINPIPMCSSLLHSSIPFIICGHNLRNFPLHPPKEAKVYRSFRALPKKRSSMHVENPPSRVASPRRQSHTFVSRVLGTKKTFELQFFPSSSFVLRNENIWMQIRITGASYVTSWWGRLEREEDFLVSKISVFPPPDLNDGLAGRSCETFMRSQERE